MAWPLEPALALVMRQQSKAQDRPGVAIPLQQEAAIPLQQEAEAARAGPEGSLEGPRPRPFLPVGTGQKSP